MIRKLKKIDYNTLSEAEQISHIRKFPLLIQYIQNPSELVKKTAIENYEPSVKYITELSNELQILAVTKYPYVIKYIKNPCKEAQIKAVSFNTNTLSLIGNAHIDTIMLYLKFYNYNKYQVERCIILFPKLAKDIERLSTIQKILD